MKKRFFCILLACLFVCAAWLPGQSAHALSLTTGTIIGNNIAFRKTASTGGGLIARLDEGTVVGLLEADVNSEWFKVQYAGKTGYIHRLYINIEPSLPSYQMDYTGTVVNCSESVNVRDSVSGDVVGQAMKGAEYPVTMAYYTAEWHEITFDGKKAYISAKYLELKAKVDDTCLTGIAVTGGTLSPHFSPKEYGYILTASQEEVTVTATANDGVKVSIGNTGIGTAKYTINSGNSKTIRISVGGRVRYSIYLVRDALTVGTWNIKRGNDNLVEQSFMIAAQKPDIIGIQEVYVNEGKHLDNLLSLRTYNAQNTAFAATLDYDSGGQYGIGQISRFKPQSNEKTKLESGGKEQRYLQKVVYDVDGQTVAVFNTHLTWESAAIRAKQFKAILSAMDADTSTYKILTGDFNAKEAEFALFKKNYKIVNTSSTKFYNYSYKRISMISIDNIIVSKNITVLNARAIPTELSDHYPLFAFLRLK